MKISTVIIAIFLTLQNTNAAKTIRNTSEKTTYSFDKDCICKEVEELQENTSKIINFSKDIKDVFISSPTIADVQVLSSKKLLLSSNAPGETNLIICDSNGKTLMSKRIIVTHNLAKLRELLKKNYPDVMCNIESANNSIIVSGEAPSPKIANEILNLVTTFSKTGENKSDIINNMTIKTPTQVMLKVKIAEVKRSVSKSLGINWRTISGSGVFNIGMLSGKLNGPIVSLTDPATFLKEQTNTIGGGRYIMNYSKNNTNLSSILDTLAAENLASILAEPTLIALSGKTATFKSGGEKGYEVAAVGGTGAGTTEFKEWGISVTFTPTVVDSNKIIIDVNPRVSSLDSEQSNTPSLRSREAQTTVELGDGQSLAIAGLMHKTKQNNTESDSLLGGLPLIGPLFKQTKVENEETELVIIVTAYIVKPSSNQMRSPTDCLPKMLSPISQNFTGKFYIPQKNKKYTQGTQLKNTGLIIS